MTRVESNITAEYNSGCARKVELKVRHLGASIPCDIKKKIILAQLLCEKFRNLIW